MVLIQASVNSGDNWFFPERGNPNLWFLWLRLPRNPGSWLFILRKRIPPILPSGAFGFEGKAPPSSSRRPIAASLCPFLELWESVTQYASVCNVWICDAEHGAFLEAAFGISRRRRVDCKRGARDQPTQLRVWESKQESWAIPDGTKRWGPGLRAQSAREWEEGVGWAAETCAAEKGRGATGRWGIAAARRGPANLALCVTPGTPGSSGLSQSSRSGKHGPRGVGVRDGRHCAKMKRSKGARCGCGWGPGVAFALGGWRDRGRLWCKTTVHCYSTHDPAANSNTVKALTKH